MISSLLIKPDLSAAAPQVHRITPQSAGWRYVGFDVFDLLPQQNLERAVADREQCLVLLSGRTSAPSASGTLRSRASRLRCTSRRARS